MRRLLPPLAALSLLACAGLLQPELVRRELPAFSIDLLAGERTQDDVYGARGKVVTDARRLSQSVSWAPFYQAPEEEAQAMLGAVAARATGPAPSVAAEAVAGSEGAGFEAELGAELLVVTVWQCPKAGVTGRLITTGPQAQARSLHARVRDGITCGAVPVTVDPSWYPWRMTGAAAWDEVPSGAEDIHVRTRPDGGMRLRVVGVATPLDPDEPGQCTATLRQVRDDMRESYVLDEGTWEDLPDGCRHTWAATRDGRPVRGRIERRGCARRGYIATCQVFTDEPLEACDGLVACATGSPSPPGTGTPPP